MNYLFDTHLLIWAGLEDERLPAEAARLLLDTDVTVRFSVASLWEVAIKAALKRPDFKIEASALRAGLRANGYLELVIEARHVLSLRELPPVHRDPFDRMLVAQAMSEGLFLLTADNTLAQYGGPVRFVK